MPPRRKTSSGSRLSGASDPGPESSAPTLTQTKLPIPRKRIGNPPERVYKSSTPLTQTKLPVPKKRIRSYGKKTTVRIPKQETLTQMDYLRMRNPPPLDDDEMDPDEIEEADEDYEKQSHKRRSKRRKTTGDEPDSTPSFYTQRLTQMDWSFTSAPDDEEDDPSIFDVPSSSQTGLPTLSSRRKTGESSKSNASKAQQSPIKEMPPPQTPRRILATEIPSSQSPATPFSTHSRGSLRRSPLKEISVNTPIPFNTGRRPEVSPDKLPKLEVKDTYDTADISQFSRVPSSPAKRSSPAKSVRFALPDQDEETEESNSPSAKRRSTPARKAVTRTEILDSDAESDEEDADFIPASDNEEDLLEEAESPELGNDDDDETVGLPGSLELDMGNDSEDQVLGTGGSPELGSDDFLRLASEQESQQEPDPETCYGIIGLETQMEADRIVGSSERRSMITPQSQKTVEAENAEQSEEDQEIEDDVENDDDDEDVPHETASEKTQIMESQRLSTQHVHSMAPRTAESDVFVSIHPTQLTNILSGAKNHEFRNWRFSIHVCRMWIYETQPVSMLKYMAEIGPAKKPGELKDLIGSGNAEFNGKASSWNAYELLQIYELADPKSLAELKEMGWFKAPPSKFARVAPAVIDELMANLLPPLFPERFNSGATLPASSSSTDTQEVDEQIVSTMMQYSQVTGNSRTLSTQADDKKIESEQEAEEVSEEEERIPSSPTPQATPRPRTRFNGPPPSQATTVDLSQTQTPTRHSQAEIIWESPARPVASSTPVTLPTPRHDSDPETQGLESHPLFSIASSQILSKTQLLSDSLLQDSVPGPPPFIQDSDDEDD
ncbi:hypothetical protein VTL71DRAFT_14266 [Oculimacula yallundae]|uniref:Uncharacterized protein n=1 Tax=Oculimacula yallundae TaxID=86028 RepID=A0ABR4CJB6_9HELO